MQEQINQEKNNVTNDKEPSLKLEKNPKADKETTRLERISSALFSMLTSKNTPWERSVNKHNLQELANKLKESDTPLKGIKLFEELSKSNLEQLTNKFVENPLSTEEKKFIELFNQSTIFLTHYSEDRDLFATPLENDSPLVLKSKDVLEENNTKHSTGNTQHATRR